MSQPDDPRTAVQVAVRLTGAVESLGEKVAALTAYGRKNRHLIVGLAVSLVLDLALTVVVAIFAVQAHDANNAAASAKLAETTLCQAGNVSRQQQLQLWGHLLSLPPAAGAPKRTKAQQAEVDAFAKYVKTVFRPRNCAAIGTGNAPAPVPSAHGGVRR